MAESDRLGRDFSNWSCPLPLADYPTIVMGHGGGGKLGNELVEHLFLPAFRNPALENLGDAAVLDLGGQPRLAMSTDSFVVQPLFFPGGSIGELAVNGTVNDLAVSGADAKVSERQLHSRRGISAGAARGHCGRDGAGGGHGGRAALLLATPRSWSAAMATAATSTPRASACCARNRRWPSSRPGGRRGDRLRNHRRPRHGHHERARGTGIRKPDPLRLRGAERHDCRGAGRGGAAVHAMRDPTRGGLASTLNEIANASQAGIAIDETSLPVRPEVQSACELLGLDPVYVANEGKVVFFVAPQAADRVLEILRAHLLGREAAQIGYVTAEHKRMLVARTAMGANRVIPMQIGEQLPRIC